MEAQIAVNNLELHDIIINDGYYKSGLEVAGYDAVYIETRTINYVDRKYETLIDSKGNKHSVQVDYESVHIKFDDSQFECMEYSEAEHLRHKFLVTENFSFRYNLKRYYMVGGSCSCYNWVGCTIQDYEHDNKIRPAHYYKSQHYKLTKLEYFPLYEMCFVSGNGATIERPISDNLFFSIEGKKNIKKAMNNLRPDCKRRLLKDGYLKMDDIQRLVYLNKRLKNKIYYIKEHKKLI